MTEKRFEWCAEIDGDFVDEYVNDNLTDRRLDKKDMFYLLNKQDKEIKDFKCRLNNIYAILIEEKCGDVE